MPTEVPALDGVVAVAAGEFHTLVLKKDGSVWAYGRNDRGQLGDGSVTDSSVPVRVPGLDNVNAIAAGESHSVAWKLDGSVSAWGAAGTGRTP